MAMLSRRRAFGLALGVAAAALPAQAQEARPVVVFAAASLQTALNAVAAEWRRETGRRVTLSYAASSALARQLEQGAPADLFASADLDWKDWAERRNLIRAGTRRTLLGNRLVLVEAADRPATTLAIAPGFRSLPRSGRAGSRPACRERAGRPVRPRGADRARRLGRGPAAPRRHRQRARGTRPGRARRGPLRHRLRDRRAHEPRVRVVGAFPAGSHAAIVYPFAVTATSTNADAGAFLAFLGSPAAIRVFEAEGFAVLR